MTFILSHIFFQLYNPSIYELLGTKIRELDIWTYDNWTLDVRTSGQLIFCTFSLFDNYTSWQLSRWQLNFWQLDSWTNAFWQLNSELFYSWVQFPKVQLSKNQMFKTSNVQKISCPYVRNLGLKFSYQKFRCPALVWQIAVLLHHILILRCWVRFLAVYGYFS